MTNERDPGTLTTAFSARQVVFGAAVVLFLTLVFAYYSTSGDGGLDAANEARQRSLDAVNEACSRYDDPDETELDEACAFLLGDDGPL